MASEVSALVIKKVRTTDYSAAEEGKVQHGEATKRRTTFSTHGNNVLITAAVLVGDGVGAGLLSMPTAVAPFGFIIGGILILAILAMHVHLCLVLWRMQMFFIDKRIDSLTGLVDHVFSRSSTRARRFATKFIAIAQNVFIFFMLAGEATSFGKGIGMIFYDVHLCFPYWVMIGLLVLCPVHFATRSLDAFDKLIFFNCFVIVVALAIPLAKFGHDGAEMSRPIGSQVKLVEDFTIMGALSAFNIMTINFGMQFMVAEVAAEMREPSKFPQAFWGIVYPFMAGIFLVAGLVGYYFLGNQAHGLLLNHLTFGLPLRLGGICLVFFVLVGYLVKSIVLCKNIHKAIDSVVAEQRTSKSYFQWMAIVSAVGGSAWLVSQVVPFFTPFFEFIGATFAPVICILMPIIMHVIWVRNFDPLHGQGLLGKAEWALLAAEFVIGFIVLTVGTYEAVQTIVVGWSTSGSPFACHCENLWNTCACSPQKLGPVCSIARNASSMIRPYSNEIRRIHMWEF